MNKNLIHYTYEGKPYTTNIQYETVRRLVRNFEVTESIISETDNLVSNFNSN
jgi:hypothetical protein